MNPLYKSFENEGFAFICNQNRSYEDRYTVVKNGNNWYYGVYDGHGNNLEERQSYQLFDSHVVLHIRDYLHEYIFSRLNDLEEKNGPLSQENVKEEIINIFIKVDKGMYEKGGSCGCTCCIVLVYGDNVYQINLGDSKSIIYSSDGLISETKDHKPDDEEEAKRIRETGGFVMKGRVNRILAMSRAFGNYSLKIVDGRYHCNGPVSSIPDIIVTKRNSDFKFILASDGLYDGFKDTKEILDIARQSLNHNEIVEQLYHKAKYCNGDDDMTIISGNINQ